MTAQSFDRETRGEGDANLQSLASEREQGETHESKREAQGLRSARRRKKKRRGGGILSLLNIVIHALHPSALPRLPLAALRCILLFAIALQWREEGVAFEGKCSGSLHCLHSAPESASRAEPAK